MSNASGRAFDNGDLIQSTTTDGGAAERKRQAEHIAASVKRYVALLEHKAIVAREWNALADEAIAMGPRPKWWRFRARRRWDRATRRIIAHWQIWRDTHREV